MTDKIEKINIPFMSMNGIKNLIKICTRGNGSCFYNSLLRSSRLTYSNCDKTTRERIVREFRNILSDMLIEKDEFGVMNYDKLSSGNLRNYSINSGDDQYTLSNLINGLRSNDYVPDNIYQPLISDNIDFDIYILKLTRENGDISFSNTFSQLTNDIEYIENGVKITHFGRFNENYDTTSVYYKDDKFKIMPVIPFEDLNELYKGRRSIILLFHADLQHYESIGKITYKNDNGKYTGYINTVFSPQDIIIQMIYYKMVAMKEGLFL